MGMTSLSMQSARQIQTRTLWKSQEPFLSSQTVLAVWLSRSLLIPMRPLVNKLAPIQRSKQKLEAEMGTLNADCDEMAGEASLSEEKAQRAMIDAARLADELRSEQDMAQTLEREKKLLEAQVKDIQARVDEAQTNALKGGKKAMTRMDTRIRELESEMDAENRRSADSQKNLRKSERKIKELAYQQDEDRKNHERMQALIDQLQGKIKSYKKQIEEAEEIAALNLAKYKQAQGNVSQAAEVADLNEQALAKVRARSRASSLAPM